jgi:hypothetical protein
MLREGGRNERDEEQPSSPEIVARAIRLMRSNL